MGIQLSDWVENIVGKGEIARKSNFFFSQNVFKSCLLLIRQNESLWSKGLKLKAYKLFVQDSDADLSWLLFLKRQLVYSSVSLLRTLFARWGSSEIDQRAINPI